jgi:hypothetical protein
MSGSAPRAGDGLRLIAPQAALARGESFLELSFQARGRDAVFDAVFYLDLNRDRDPDSRGVEVDDVHVVGHMVPVCVVIALALLERVFTRPFPMNQAHAAIIGEVSLML